MKITVIDPVLSKADKELFKAIENNLLYDKPYWKQNRYGREKVDNQGCIIDRRSGTFLTGHIPRLQKLCKTKKLALEIEYKYTPKEFKIYDPSIAGLTLREDQTKFIEFVIQEKRGLVISATGTGKSIIINALLNAYRDCRILFLCHNKSLVRQAAKSFMARGITDIGYFNSDVKGKIGDERIVCCNIQTLINYPVEVYCDRFDVVIIDEAHRVNATDKQYSFVLKRMLAEIRIGFTGTLPTLQVQKYAQEGLLGPVLGTFDITEAIEKGVLAKVNVTLVPIDFDSKINDKSKSYDSYYKNAIVENTKRNQLIASIANKRVKNGDSILIMVREIKHGKNLQRYLDILGIKTSFVQGSTDDKVRERIQNELNAKKIKCVIATSVWKEGIDIPELNVVMLAGGGKDYVPLMQMIGRGTRKTVNKNEMELVDFLDPYRYLAEHTVRRLQVYMDKKFNIVKRE